MQTFTSDALPQLEAILAEAAQAEVMPRFGQLSAAQVRTKSSSFDIVTDADVACEQAITSQLLARFPGAVVIGEETSAHRPGLLGALQSEDLVFLIDPLDGTRNFASGLPLFGVMAAVLVRGEVVAGAIHDPVTGTTAMAAAGTGAWMQERSGASTRLHVAAPVPVSEMEGIVGTNFLPSPLKERVNSNLARIGMTNWFRCAAHEYRLAAAGHCHVLFYNRLMPWDHAAGWLLHREAGGYGAHFDGSPYVPSHTSGGLLYAPDKSSWEAVRAALLD